MEAPQVTSGYIVIAVLVLSSFGLLCVNIHLCVAWRKQYTKKGHSDNSAWALFCLAVTCAAIISFQITIFFIVLCILHIILIAQDDLHPESSTLHRIYYVAFEEMEFLIPVFDQLGHLCMLTVFVKRFQLCFKGALYGYSRSIIRTFYACLCVLALFSGFILIEIALRGQNTWTIIICETVWEVLIELIALCILYLFVSRLYALLTMTMATSHSRSATTSTATKSNSQLTQIEYLSTTMTRNRSLENNDSARSKTESSHDHDDHGQVQVTMDGSSDRQVIDLVNVMNKMTYLVLIAVFGSFLSVAGNVFIQTELLRTLDQHIISMNAIWAYLLLAADAVIASVTMYLQFAFCSPVYSKLCNKCDFLFLRCCLNLNRWYARNHEPAQNTKEERTVSVAENTMVTIQSSQRGEHEHSEMEPAKLEDDRSDGIEIVFSNAMRQPSPTPASFTNCD